MPRIPLNPLRPAYRTVFAFSPWFEWHIAANFEMKKSYSRWYAGVFSSIFAKLTNESVALFCKK